MTSRSDTPGGEVIVYRTDDGRNRIQVLLAGETVWLTQAMMSDLYESTKQNISLHIQNIYDDDELTPGATVKEYLTVRSEGSREVKRRVSEG